MFAPATVYHRRPTNTALMISSMSGSDQNATENEVGASIIDIGYVGQFEWDIIACEQKTLKMHKIVTLSHM